jgi:Cu/Ag efflux pump CusA
VRIYGSELEGLRAKAAEVNQTISGIQGVTNLKVEQQVLVPQIEVRLRHDAAARFGLTPGDVRPRRRLHSSRALKSASFTPHSKSMTWWSGARRIRAATSKHCAGCASVYRTGGDAPLSDVADLQIAPAPNVIQREGASRRIDVTCDVKDRDLGSVAHAKSKPKVKALSFERGYHPEFLGEYAARQESKNRLLALSALALVAILLLLHADFRAPRLVGLVFFSLPFALVGGVAAHVAHGRQYCRFGSLVGFVTVLGIAARNGIMLVSHYRHLETEEGEVFGPELVLRGSAERLTPILMTCAGNGAGVAAHRHRRQQTGARDRASAGGGNFGRTGYFNDLESVSDACALSAI